MSINARIKTLIACLVVMAAGGLIVLILPPHGQLAYTRDSIQYLDAARNLVNGRGLRLFNFSLFDPQYIPSDLGSLLYPLVLATGINPEWIQVLSVAGVAALTCWLLGRRASYPLTVACGLTLLVTLPWPVLLDASYVWTEPLTIFWVFVAMVALGGMGDSGLRSFQRDVWYWLVAVISVVMAVYTEDVAILFVPGMMLALLRAPIPRRQRITLVIATPFTAGVLLLPFFTHHLMTSQYLSTSVHPHLSLLAMLSSQFLYYGWMFAITPITQTLLVIFAISLVLASVLYWKDSRQRLSRAADPTILNAKWLGWIAGSLVFSYFFGIILLRHWIAFDGGPRVLSPGMPLLLLVLAAFMRVMWKSANLRWEKMALALPVLGALSLTGVTSWQLWNPVYHNWRARGTPEWPKSPVQVYNDFYPVTLPKLTGLVLCEHPDVMAFRTGWKARQIPSEFGSHETLMRIAHKASAVVISSRKAERLAEKLRGIVDHPRLLHLGGDAVLVWQQGERNKP